MSFFFSPLLSLFSRNFYRRMARAGLGRGFSYLVYLAVLMTAVAGTTLAVRVLPEMDRFAVWLKGEMPLLIWKPAEGLSMKDKTTFSLVHPQYGPLARLDMTKTEIKVEDMGENSIFVTAKKIYIKQPGRNELRIYDLMQARTKAQPGNAAGASAFEIKPEDILKTYRQFRPWIVAIFCAILLGVFLVWKLLAALFYSWIGLLINFTCKEKLDYSHLLTLAFFVLTPAALIQLLQWVIPRLAAIPFGLAGSLSVTTLYLLFAIKSTQPTESSLSHPAA